MSADRDLAEAIYQEVISPQSIAEALDIWRFAFIEEPGEGRRMTVVLASIAASAIDAVLARRLREAARTGPWGGGHHFQEEDGYPGSLLPPKRSGP